MMIFYYYFVVIMMCLEDICQNFLGKKAIEICLGCFNEDVRGMIGGAIYLEMLQLDDECVIITY